MGSINGNKDRTDAMPPEEVSRIINGAVETFGHTPQLNQACQELAELICSITKHIQIMYSDLDGAEFDYAITTCIDSIKFEMADVLIMLEQLKLIYKIDEEELCRAVEMKLQRLDGVLKGASAEERAIRFSYEREA